MKKIVLLVESKDLRSIFRHALEKSGFIVYEIDTVKEFLDSQKFDPSKLEEGVLDTIDVDLFVIDLDLETANGLEILWMIKEHLDFRDIPIIVNSVRDDKETIVSAISGGATDYVLRQGDFVSLLIQKIDKLFEKELSTFETAFSRELDWISYGKKELAFAYVSLSKGDEKNSAIEKSNYDTVVDKLKEKLRLYDWIFPLDKRAIALILPLASVKNLVVLRRRLLESLDNLKDELHFQLSAQIGFSHFPTNAKTKESLISIAKSQIK